MKISFDLDDTLIAGAVPFEVESPTLIHKLLRMEQIRNGTISLFKYLQAEGHEVSIYTSSLRSIFKIRLNFWLYGIYKDQIYNKSVHDICIKSTGIYASKYPPMFGIDVHVDDSEGLRREGEKYNFRTIIIDPNDIDWVNKILGQI